VSVVVGPTANQDLHTLPAGRVSGRHRIPVILGVDKDQPDQDTGRSLSDLRAIGELAMAMTIVRIFPDTLG
jgi:hypothetical protein